MPRSYHILFLMLFVFFAGNARANQRAQGWCMQGGQVVVTGANSSTTRVQRSYPQCLVTVYLTGTTTLATIFSDNSATSLANPFTSSTTGYWYWYAANGRYDVRLSGGGISSPFTLGDILLADPQGFAGGVTSIVAGTGIAINQPTGAVTISATSQGFPLINPADYIFTPQIPGTSLTGLITNSVILTPCPRGVNASDIGHWLYISGGTGTAEPVKITGGSCTSQATTGTVTFVPVNSHSGSWAISSATFGTSEAVFANFSSTQGGQIYIPGGLYHLLAPIVIPFSNITIQGVSSGGTKISCDFTTGSCFDFDGSLAPGGVGFSNSILDMTIFNNASSYGSGRIGVDVQDQNTFRARGLNMTYMSTGVQVLGAGSFGIFLDFLNISMVQPTSGIGISVDFNGDFYLANTFIGGQLAAPGRAGIELINGGGFYLTSVDLLGNTNNIRITPGSGKIVNYVFCTECISDASIGDSTLLAPTGTGVVHTAVFTNSWFSSAGAPGIISPPPTANGFACTPSGGGVVSFVELDGSRFVNNTKNGADFGPGCDWITILGGLATQNSIGTATNTYNGWNFQNNVNHIHVEGITGDGTPGWGLVQNYTLYITGPTNNDLTILGLKQTDPPSFKVLFDGSTSTNKNILAPNALSGALTIASSATIDPGTSDVDTLNITGGTGIATITRGWNSRVLHLIKLDGVPTTLIAGGNITHPSLPLTLGNGGKIDCLYNPGFALWFCK